LCIGTRLRFTDVPDVLVWVEKRAGYAHLRRLLTEGKRRAGKGSCILQLNDLLAALTARNVEPQSPHRAPNGQ
jgi:error-prone DNA polymerase